MAESIGRVSRDEGARHAALERGQELLVQGEVGVERLGHPRRRPSEECERMRGHVLEA